VLLANHAQPPQPIEMQAVEVELVDAPPPQSVSLERIDDDHANAKTAWLRLGAPEYLNPAEVEQREEASCLIGEPHG
jgi:xylan 1,4-beta-xylosidase